MSGIDKNLVMDLRRHLKIVQHRDGKIKLRYRMGAIGIFKQIEKSSGGLMTAIQGVRKASVNPVMFTLTIDYDPTVIEPTWWTQLIQDGDDSARRILDRLSAA